MRLFRKIGAIALTLVVAVPLACAEPSSASPYSKAEIQQMIRRAHTSQEYRTLAEYFRARQQMFKQQASAEMLEWERRSENVTGPAAKYPRPVDSSKNRYEYFHYEAAEMAQKADYYEALEAKTN